ncbi:unnamed protein product [Lactuca virosa]|uniref:DUF4378 domain-containing protein n=1 Tax=Lactuca virosa TaxID=75947 RepID=A0AAU9NBP9_9ASTR|nr:unnamed protein product [Lactuca virosa]
MGKLLCTEDGDHFNNIHPGCMSGVFPVLDYQNWHSNVKKILPHRKQAKQQKTNGGILHYQDSFETSQLSSGKRSLIQTDQSNRKHNSHRRSIKDRLKSLVSEDTLKNDHKKRGRMLQRTYSIHHLETDEWVHYANSEEFSEKNPDKKDTNKEIKDYVDISENSRILLDGLKVSLTKAKLTKSGSFPSMLGSRNLRPTKLKHKLNEFYSMPKNKKGSDNWARKLDLSKLESLMIELDDEQDGKNMEDDLNNGSVMSIKRICSLNDRHAQLFDNGDTKEAILCSFRSLKLTNHISNSDFQLTDFYSLSIEEESGQKTQDIKSNTGHQLEFQISKGLKPLCVSEEGVKDNIKSVNSNTHDHNDEYFNYVREILEQSGFIKNGFEQTWYSSNQLLNPSMFQGIESQYQCDPESFEEEVIKLSHDLHRFELVDETLLKLYERSFSYYPKALSYSCHLSPAPSGKLVLEEVWKSVSRLLKLNPNKDQSLEYIVSWDLNVGGDWMNLQMESECIALELEDMIFNELLGDVFSS